MYDVNTTWTHPDPEVANHLNRIWTSIHNSYDLSSSPEYMERHTYLGGARFSFKNHEYLRDILSDTSRTLYCQKCAQVGLTEAQIRYALALARMIPYLSVIMTWPSATDATRMAFTRVDPVIDASPDLKKRIRISNAGYKQIDNSLVYLKGTLGETSAISTAADVLIHDEVDRSDEEKLGQYRSRLRHSRYRIIREFGTPTYPGVGINLRMQSAKRKHQMWKCSHCNHQFLPDYEKDVDIPGWGDRPKEEMTKAALITLDWSNTVLRCPRCKGIPSADLIYRQWVVENNDSNFDAVGYFVTPFCAPQLMPPPRLVEESTEYKTYTEFQNQCLGLVSTEGYGGISADLIRELVRRDLELKPEYHAMGVDMGAWCHFTIGRQCYVNNRIEVVWRERVPLVNFREAKQQFQEKYAIASTVMDAYPYSETVMQLQTFDKNLYAAIYSAHKDVEVFRLKSRDECAKEGKLPLNTLEINRNPAFEELFAKLVRKEIVFRYQDDELETEFIAQMTDMQRKLEYVERLSKMLYVWRKSELKNDHYHNSLLYMSLAVKLLPARTTSILSLAGVPLVTSFKVKAA